MCYFLRQHSIFFLKKADLLWFAHFPRYHLLHYWYHWVDFWNDPVITRPFDIICDIYHVTNFLVISLQHLFHNSYWGWEWTSPHSKSSAFHDSAIPFWTTEGSWMFNELFLKWSWFSKVNLGNIGATDCAERKTNKAE